MEEIILSQSTENIPVKLDISVDNLKKETMEPYTIRYISTPHPASDHHN